MHLPAWHTAFNIPQLGCTDCCLAQVLRMNMEIRMQGQRDEGTRGSCVHTVVLLFQSRTRVCLPPLFALFPIVLGTEGELCKQGCQQMSMDTSRGFQTLTPYEGKLFWWLVKHM